MARLKRVMVEGLSGRDEPLIIEFKEDTNIIFGMNGSGKTSLLKIISSALSNDSSTIKRLNFKKATVEFYSDDLKIDITRTIEATDDTEIFPRLVKHKNGNIELKTPKKFEWRSKESDKRFMHKFLAASRIYVEPSISTPNISNNGDGSFNENQINQIFTIIVNNLWLSYNSKIQGEINAAQEEGFAEVLLSLVERDDNEHHLDGQLAFDLFSNFTKQRNLSMKKLTKRKFIAMYEDDIVLRSAMGKLMSIEIRTIESKLKKMKLEHIINNMINKNKQIFFTDGGIRVVESIGDKKTIDLGHLSSGEKQLIRIILEAISMGSGILIVDEPELSMHIDWQENLISTIRELNPEAQLVFATHSPEIMAHTNSDHIFKV